MAQILFKAGAFISIILLGYILKKINFVKEEDFHVLAKIVLKITLPAAIITNFAGTSLEPKLLVLSLLGLLCGTIMIITAFVITSGKNSSEKAFHIINMSGYNIGNFSMPFIQGFLGASGVVATSLFDAGNSIIVLGLSFSIAMIVKNKDSRISISSILKTLFKSTAFDVYIIMTVLSLIKVSLPAPVLELSGIIGNANTFLAMFMIGVGFKLSGKKEQLGAIVKLLAVRYGIAIILSIVFYNLLPFPIEYRQALAILVFSPIASAAPPFTAEAGEDYGLASAVNSMSILISIIAITTVLILLL